MGRFSPTVHPEPIRFSEVLSTYLDERDRKRRQRTEETAAATAERERLEDRQRAQADVKARDLLQPGARTLAEHLRDLDQYDLTDPTAAGGPLTTETLARVGNAAADQVPLEFRTPPAEKVQISGQAKPMLRQDLAEHLREANPMLRQDRAPVITGSGVVIDPRAARREASLASALEREAKFGDLRRELDLRESYEPERPKTVKEQLAFKRRAARAEAEGRGGTGTPVALTALERQIDDARQQLSTMGMLTAYPPGKDDWAGRARHDRQRAEMDEIQQRLAGLERRRDAAVRQLGGQPPALLERRAPPPTGGAGFNPWSLGGLTRPVRPEERGGQTATERLPVSQAEYEGLVEEYGEEYARTNFVIQR